MMKLFKVRIVAIFLIILVSSSCSYASLGSNDLLTQPLANTTTEEESATPWVATATYTFTPTPFQPLPTATPTLDPTSTPTFTPSPIPTATATPEPTSTSSPTLPAEHTITNIWGHAQYFELDCEAAAAEDWANYFGVKISEIEFQNKLPHSDNPDFGFVGNPRAPWGELPPNGYGVYAGPVADLLKTYGVSARAYKSYTIDQVKAKIAQDIPVIAWVIGNVISGIPVPYIDTKGRVITVAMYEHVVIVTGYTENHIYYMNQGIIYWTTTPLFLRSWEVLGNMVIVDR